jgi:predicted heme/steroid binding protein
MYLTGRQPSYNPFPPTQNPHIVFLMGRGADAGKSKGTKGAEAFTMEEVAKHCTEEDGWIVFEGKIYDVSGFVSHPGGKVIFTYLGRDATDVFRAFHAEGTEKQLRGRYMGDVVGPVVREETEEERRHAAFVRDYRELRGALDKAGLFRAE